MSSFMVFAAIFVLAVVAVGLVRVLRGPATADRLMAAQLLGTGAIAALLLISVATDSQPVVDLALSLALLAAFASIAFVMAASPPDPGPQEAADK